MALATEHEKALRAALAISAPFSAEDLVEECLKQDPDDVNIKACAEQRLTQLEHEGYIVKQYVLTDKGRAFQEIPF